MLNLLKEKIMNIITQQKGIYILNSFILGLVLLLSVESAYSQESKAPKANKSRLKLEYTKKSDNSIQLEAKLSSRINRKPVAVTNTILSFYDQTDSSVLLKSAITDKKGKAKIVLSPGYPIGRDTLSTTFSVIFEGNDQYKPSSKELTVKDARMDVGYETVDSIHTVTVSAYELNNGKPGTPLTDLDVYVYVKRLFSLLKVGEGWLQDGEATIEIPDDLPGDVEGNLNFVTIIPETDNYGTIENEATVNWGIRPPVQNKYANESKRALWEPKAPFWMVITLGILILGVFYHYFLILYKLFKIKKIGKQTSGE